jgi:hypothetical protein
MGDKLYYSYIKRRLWLKYGALFKDIKEKDRQPFASGLSSSGS